MRAQVRIVKKIVVQALDKRRAEFLNGDDGDPRLFHRKSISRFIERMNTIEKH